MTDWVIRSNTGRDDSTGAPLYWSNKEGWVDRDSADVFTDFNRQTLTPTDDGVWVPGVSPIWSYEELDSADEQYLGAMNEQNELQEIIHHPDVDIDALRKAAQAALNGWADLLDGIQD